MKPTKEYNGRSRIRMFNCDCMEFMAQAERYDLAIVDPPYGVNMGNKINSITGGIKHKPKNWDKYTPDQAYWDSLFLVSKNQIVWGGNYFISKIKKDSPCWIFWDKNNGESLFADGEMAWTSFNSPIRKAVFNWCGSASIHETGTNKIHPTQKPYRLYKWLLTNYAKEGDTILDTHGGSMSIAIACWDLGFDLDICELDPDYFNDAVKRFESYLKRPQPLIPETVEQRKQNRFF